MPEPVIMTRWSVAARLAASSTSLFGKPPPTRIFEAAWDLVVTAAAVRGIHEDQLRFQRSVTRVNAAESATRSSEATQ